MGEFVVNKDMFGQYVKIPTGYSKEMHIYKVVSRFCSNTYCDVPIVHGAEPTYHEAGRKSDNPYGLETVLNVIHCGIDESEVIRVALKDCEIVNPKTNADRIRSMTDEQLAEILVYYSQGVWCTNVTNGRYWSYEETAIKSIVEFLQSEVEEE